jgi:hypothetical protein
MLPRGSSGDVIPGMPCLYHSDGRARYAKILGWIFQGVKAARRVGGPPAFTLTTRIVSEMAMFRQCNGRALLPSGSFQVQRLTLSLQFLNISIGGIECTLGIYLLLF